MMGGSSWQLRVFASNEREKEQFALDCLVLALNQMSLLAKSFELIPRLSPHPAGGPRAIV